MHTELLPATLAYPAPPAPRSPGIHLSAVLRNIAAENGVLKPEWIEDFNLRDLSSEAWWGGLEDSDRLRMSIGLAWENWYVPQIPNIIHQPGEMQVDGVYMTHDGESLDVIATYKDPRTGIYLPLTDEQGTDYLGLTVEDTNYLCLHECKATYKSTKTVGDLSTQWLWLAQTKGYCKGIGSLVAYLHVLFLCGDYKYPIRPQLRVWRITYTQAEIDEGWDIITGYVLHRAKLERGDYEDHGLEGR